MEQKQPRERVLGIPDEMLYKAALEMAPTEGLKGRILREIERDGDPLLPITFAGGKGSKAAVELARKMRRNGNSGFSIPESQTSH